jgi:hypothetical protein
MPTNSGCQHLIQCRHYGLTPSAGVFPLSSGDFEALAAAVERLTLNDASVSVARESSNALGAGFRCGCASRSICRTPLLPLTVVLHSLRPVTEGFAIT